MEILIERVAHPRELVRLVGAQADDEYFEKLWTPRVGPTAVMLVRRAHDLAGPVGSEPRAIEHRELAAMLGVGAGTTAEESERLARNSRLAQTLKRCHQFGLARWHFERRLLQFHEPQALLSERHLRQLPSWCRQQHAGYLERRLAEVRTAHPGQELDPDTAAAANRARALRQLHRLTAEPQREPPATSTREHPAASV